MGLTANKKPERGQCHQSVEHRRAARNCAGARWLEIVTTPLYYTVASVEWKKDVASSILVGATEPAVLDCGNKRSAAAQRTRPESEPANRFSAFPRTPARGQRE